LHVNDYDDDDDDNDDDDYDDDYDDKSVELETYTIGKLAL
jgi:hypothetical protein